MENFLIQGKMVEIITLGVEMQIIYVNLGVVTLMDDDRDNSDWEKTTNLGSFMAKEVLGHEGRTNLGKEVEEVVVVVHLATAHDREEGMARRGSGHGEEGPTRQEKNMWCGDEELRVAEERRQN